MDTTERYEKALKRLQALAATEGARFGSCVSAEQEYAIAYDDLVRQGRAPKLRAKYRNTSSGASAAKSDGRSGTSAGKHTPHPHVHGYRRNGYRCEPKWNPKP